MTPRERDELIDALLEQAISDADFLRLEAELHTSRSARDAYYARLKLHTILLAEIEASKAVADETGQSSAPQTLHPERNYSHPVHPMHPMHPVHPAWLAIAALVPILLGSLLWFTFGTKNDTRLNPGPGTTALAPGNEPVAHGFASLIDQSDAVWETVGHDETDASINLQRGDLIPAGSIHLKAGEAQIEFFSGALVSLEAGARFEVISAMELDMRHGNLRAHVPEPAQGFLIRTPSGQLIDLGTEFSLDVTADHSDMKVIDGEIQWHPDQNRPKINLTKGKSLRWQKDQDQASPVTTFADASASPESTLHKKLGMARLQRKLVWEEFTQNLRQRPDILAYYSFGETGDWVRQLQDDGPGAHHGTIIRGQRTTGRWHDTSALDFSPTGSRVRFNVPGTHSNLTLACWVKVNSLDRWYNSLMLTDGHEIGEAHWQILENGQIHFSVKKQTATETEKDKVIHLSPPVWSPEQSGQWMHLAVVYNTERKLVSHYRNGKRLHREEIPENYLVDSIRIGAANLGNWSEPKRNDPAFAIRNLNGSITEFIMLSSALTDRDVREIYFNGRP